MTDKTTPDEERESDGPILYAVDVPESERSERGSDTAERYEVRKNNCPGGCIVWARYHGEWMANPWSTRWLIRHLIEERKP